MCRTYKYKSSSNSCRRIHQWSQVQCMNIGLEKTSIGCKFILPLIIGPNFITNSLHLQFPSWSLPQLLSKLLGTDLSCKLVRRWREASGRPGLISWNNSWSWVVVPFLLWSNPILHTATGKQGILTQHMQIILLRNFYQGKGCVFGWIWSVSCRSLPCTAIVTREFYEAASVSCLLLFALAIIDFSRSTIKKTQYTSIVFGMRTFSRQLFYAATNKKKLYLWDLVSTRLMTLIWLLKCNINVQLYAFRRENFAERTLHRLEWKK